MSFEDFIRWATKQGTFIKPEELFAFVERVKAGEITPTEWERRMFATMAGLMVATAPDFIKGVIEQAQATMRTDAVQDFLSVQTFVALVDDVVAKSDDTLDFETTLRKLLKVAQEAALTAAPTKGKPS